MAARRSQLTFPPPATPGAARPPRKPATASTPPPPPTRPRRPTPAPAAPTAAASKPPRSTPGKTFAPGPELDELLIAGDLSERQLAARYGVSRSTIQEYKKRNRADLEAEQTRRRLALAQKLADQDLATRPARVVMLIAEVNKLLALDGTLAAFQEEHGLLMRDVRVISSGKDRTEEIVRLRFNAPLPRERARLAVQIKDLLAEIDEQCGHRHPDDQAPGGINIDARGARVLVAYADLPPSGVGRRPEWDQLPPGGGDIEP